MSSSCILWCLSAVLSLVLCPLLSGIINKVKAFFAGRRGPSIFQLYYDIRKLLRKGSVYSSTATHVLRLAPLCSLAALFGCVLLLPFGMNHSLCFFRGYSAVHLPARILPRLHGSWGVGYRLQLRGNGGESLGSVFRAGGGRIPVHCRISGRIDRELHAFRAVERVRFDGVDSQRHFDAPDLARLFPRDAFRSLPCPVRRSGDTPGADHDP